MIFRLSNRLQLFACWTTCFTVVITLLLARTNAQESCLGWLETERKASYGPFDIEHDRNERSRSFSCDAGITASDALRLIEDFRYGFLYDSEEHIEQSVRFPLTIRVKEKESVGVQTLKIATFMEWVVFKANHFDRNERALIACATLGNVRLFRKWNGFAIGLGRVWFLESSGESHKVAVINVKPLKHELFKRLCVGDEDAESASSSRTDGDDAGDRGPEPELK